MNQKINLLMSILIIGALSATAQGRCGRNSTAIPENKVIGSLVMRNFDENQIFERIQARYLLPVVPVSIMVDRNIIREFTTLSIGYTHRESHKYVKNSWSITPYAGISFVSDSLLIGNNLSGEFLISTPATSIHGGLSFLLQNEKWYTHCEVRYTHMGNSADGLLNGEIWRSVERKMAIGIRVRANYLVHNMWANNSKRMYSTYLASAMFQHNFSCYVGARICFEINYNSFEKKKLGGAEIGLVIGIPHPKKFY